MDIRKLSVSNTATLHLRGPDDALLLSNDDPKKPVQVVLYSPGSKQFAAAAAERDNRLTERLKRSGKTHLTPELRIEERANFLTKCTHSFNNLSYDDLSGEQLAKALYSDVSLGFIADQVEKHLSDWANFTQASQTQ